MNKPINIKKKLRSKTFLVSMFSAILILIKVIGSSFGIDFTTFSEKANEIFRASLTILELFGEVT